MRDCSVGIAPAHHTRISEEFYQVGNVGRDRASGLGLGLSIVQRLADLLLHPLGLVSATGCGSTFWVGVQATASSVSAVANVALSPRALSAAPLSGYAVYLIENDDQMARALAREADFTRWTMTAIAPRVRPLAEALLKLTEAMQQTRPKVRWVVDVDPYDFG